MMSTNSCPPSRLNAMLSSAALSVALIGGGVFLAAPGAGAQSAEEFFRGKNITMIVSAGAGGGYDSYARFLARHLDRNIPGRPGIIVQNMEGAGGIRAANWLYNVAPRDGLTLAGQLHNGLIIEPLLGNPRAEFDASKFGWIGSIATQYNACMVWHTSPVQTIQDAMEREVRVSTTSATGNTAKTPLLLNKLLGTKFNVISGYSTTGMRLAVEQGEVEGICGLSYDTYVAANPDWIQNNRIRFILQSGSQRIAELPDVPSLYDFVTDPLQKQALEIVSIKDEAGRPVLYPPEVPAHLLAAMRQAFNATMKDPQFLEEGRRLGIEPTPVTGEWIQKAITQVYQSPREAVDLAAELWPPAGR